MADLAEQSMFMNLITDDEGDLLIMALANARGARAFTQDEAQKLLEWARQVRMEAAMLRIVLKGAAYCDIDEQGEFVLVGLVDTQDPAA